MTSLVAVYVVHSNKNANDFDGRAINTNDIDNNPATMFRTWPAKFEDIAASMTLIEHPESRQRGWDRKCGANNCDE